MNIQDINARHDGDDIVADFAELGVKLVDANIVVEGVVIDSVVIMIDDNNPHTGTVDRVFHDYELHDDEVSFILEQLQDSADALARLQKG